MKTFIGPNSRSRANPWEDEDEYIRRATGYRNPEDFLPGPIPPDNPQMVNVGGHQYPVSLPEARSHYVWFTNRDTEQGNWYRTGDPIFQSEVGPTGFQQIGDDGVFGPEHHGMNVGAEVSMSDEQLRDNLRRWGLPTDGNREDLLARNIRVKTDPDLMQRLVGGGERPTQRDIYNVVNNPERNPSLGEANRLRQLRQSSGLYDRVSQQPGASPQTSREWTGGGGRPSGNPLSAVEQAGMSSWGQSNLQRAANQSVPRASALGTGTNPMTIGSLESPAAAGGAEGLGGGAAATGATEAGAGSALASGLGTAGMFAARAMPVLNVAMMGTMLYNMMQSQNKAKEAEERQRSMRI